MTPFNHAIECFFELLAFNTFFLVNDQHLVLDNLEEIEEKVTAVVTSL